MRTGDLGNLVLTSQSQLLRLITDNIGGGADEAQTPGSTPAQPAATRSDALPPLEAASRDAAVSDHALQEESAAGSDTRPDTTSRSLAGLRPPTTSASASPARAALLDRFVRSLAAAGGNMADASSAPAEGAFPRTESLSPETTAARTADGWTPREQAAAPQPATSRQDRQKASSSVATAASTGNTGPGTAAKPQSAQPDGRTAPVGAVGMAPGTDGAPLSDIAAMQPASAAFTSNGRGAPDGPGTMAGAPSVASPLEIFPAGNSTDGGFRVAMLDHGRMTPALTEGGTPEHLPDEHDAPASLLPRETAESPLQPGWERAAAPVGGSAPEAADPEMSGAMRRDEAASDASQARAQGADASLDAVAAGSLGLRPDEAGTLAQPVASAAPAAADDALAASLSVVGFAELSAAAASPLPERAGVIASFILNAHFLPGWPPPRPIELPAAMAARPTLAELAAKLTEDEREKLAYLAKLGLTPAQMERLVLLALRARRRSKLFEALAVILTNVTAVLDALREEAAALGEELAARGTEGRRRARLELR